MIVRSGLGRAALVGSNARRNCRMFPVKSTGIRCGPSDTRGAAQGTLRFVGQKLSREALARPRVAP